MTHQSDILIIDAINCIYKKNDIVKGMQLLENALAEGNSWAAVELGNVYDFGMLPRNCKKVISYFQMAAKMGNAEAYCILGYLHSLGFEVKRDLTKAKEMLDYSASKGIPFGIFMMFHEFKTGTKEQADKAFVDLKKLADTGNVRDKWRLGRILYYGLGVAPDYDLAFKLNSDGSDLGYALCINNLGLCYRNARGVPKNAEKSFECYMKAAKQEYSVAICNVGISYEFGIGVEKDRDEAFKYYMKAADYDYYDAYYHLGCLYHDGTDYSKAVYYYEKAVEQLSSEAMNNLGICYELGEGTERSFEKAVQMYRQSAELGDEVAEHNLGNSYYNGTLISRDYVEAGKWYLRSANKGYSLAQRCVSNCYKEGIGLPEDPILAFNYCKKAAKQNEKRAMKLLIRFYEIGFGHPTDIEKAKIWKQKYDNYMETD